MIKIDPIIAVKDLNASARWYQAVLGCGSTGQHFIRLISDKDETLLCLHNWGEHDHPTMKNPEITAGNGLILYFRTDKLNEIRHNVEQLGCPVEEDIHLNPNSGKREFSLRDPDGYYLTITEYHTYEG